MEKLTYTLENLIKNEDYDISNIEWKGIFSEFVLDWLLLKKDLILYITTFIVRISCFKIQMKNISTNTKIIFIKSPFNKIVKIIDFGRATFTHNNIIYFSDAFDENGDAEGQYDYPENNSFRV